jgi:hypothetical protein
MTEHEHAKGREKNISDCLVFPSSRLPVDLSIRIATRGPKPRSAKSSDEECRPAWVAPRRSVRRAKHPAAKWPVRPKTEARFQTRE